MTVSDKLEPLDTGWRMKDSSSADTDISRLDDNRDEITIHHELIGGVSPKMIIWWFRNFPVNPAVPGSGYLMYKGRRIQAYRLWHPVDHLECKVKKSALDGSQGYGKGAVINIRERLGDWLFDTDMYVKRIDESGLELSAYKGLIKFAEFRHYFIETLEGTICESSAIVGSFVPLFGRIITPVIKWKIFKKGLYDSWIKHNIEETGNFQFFLPTLYEFGFEKAFR